MGKGRGSDTGDMWRALEEQLSTRSDQQEVGLSVFPKPFLISLRFALESGLSCQQITSMIILQTSLMEMSHLDKGSLLSRVHRLVEIMRKDLEGCQVGHSMKQRICGD